MGLLTSISGAAWPTSGAATQGTTGLEIITGGTHVGSTDVPEGSLATGYIQGTDGGAMTVRIDPTANVLAANESDIWFTVPWEFEVTGAGPADSTSLQFNLAQNIGTKLRTYFYYRNSTHNPGLGVSVTEFLTGGTNEKLFSCGASGSPALIPFNEVVWITFHISRSTAAGVYEIYINGVLVQRHSGLPTDGEVTMAQLRVATSMTWPATAGIRARIHGGMHSYDGTGPALRPMHNMFGANAYIAQSHMVDASLDQTNTNGKSWTYSGTATRTLAQYSASGSTPARFRWLYAGTAATWNQTLIDDIGTTPYGPTGVCNYLFRMLYIPDGSAQIVIRTNSGGDITLDIVGSELKYGSTVLAPWNHAHRYSVAVSIENDATVRFLLSSMTGDNISRNAWSGTIPTVTQPAYTRGTVTISGVTGTATAECDGLQLYRLLPIDGVDSLSHVYSSTVTPQMAITNHMSEALAPATDAVLIPGAAHPNRVWGSVAMPSGIVAGRAGQTRNAFQTNWMAYATGARGLIIRNFDGGSVNDFNASAMTNTAQQTAILDGMQAHVEAMCDQVATMKSIVWLTTMLLRPSGFVWTALQLEAMTLYSARMRIIAVAKQLPIMHIRFSDPAAVMTNPSDWFVGATDPTHPTSTGDAEFAKQMILLQTTPALGGGARRSGNLGLGLGIGFG